MDGSNSFGDGLGPWTPQQVEFQEIKAQQDLSKQHFGSPIVISDHYTVDPAESNKAGLGGMAGQTQDYSELEKLSSEYQPDLQGPLVGEVKSSRALEVEYANADPAFVRKTIALSPKYSHYRTVLGDGNCGWRAVAFGYFELLLRTGDLNLIGMEHARIASLNNLMDAAGFRSYLYEDFIQATYNLFIKLQSTEVINAPYDDTELLAAFTQSGVSDAIITHFKFLTSAWMKTRSEFFQPFLGQTVEEYCETHVEPYAIEIDHVGLMALIDVLVLPAQFAVEVFYLDRSDGDEVNVHRFHKLEGEMITPHDAAVLRLLYRPGHYDIIYKKGEIFPQTQESIQVSFLPALPGPNFSSTPLALLPHFASVDRHYDHPEPGPSNFRPSVFNLPAFQPSPLQSLPFQTTTFRNSPFNPSHFQSENFQPEIYQPPSYPASSSKRYSSERQNALSESRGSDDGSQYSRSPRQR
ncbi:hypothetical protein RUND412_008812 [Rhizina undulata]